MNRWPFILVTVLVSIPLILMCGVGGWALWQSGHWFWISWTLTICWSAAWLIYRFARRVEVPLPEIGSKIHWTPRDHDAAALIEAEQKRVSEFTGEQLADPQFYVTRSIELATEFARHYHPNATDPLGSASVVEILTTAQLVTADLETTLRESVPGSHLITVSQWRLLAKAPAWWRNLSNIGWLAAIVFNPASLARYAVSRTFVEPLSKQLQTNILGTFYALFVRQLGFYLIELNSGRLRGGSAAYRAAMHKLEPVEPSESGEVTQVPTPVTVTIAVIGQVKAGKSSLVNCLLGEQKAAVDVLPLTRNVQRYDLRSDDRSDRLILLDTPGYSDSGATQEQLAETFEAVRNADIVLLVMDVRSPAKQADVSTLDKLDAWFEQKHQFKPPAIVGVVSKIDGLSPLMEWSPPYSWENPNRPKEKNIRAALEFAKETFGNRLSSIIPVCTDIEHHRVFGIEEYLLPTISLLLDEARACSLVRSLHRDYDQARAWQVVSQLVSAGTKIKEYAPEFIKSQVQQFARTLLQTTKK
jgi:predicted GTPase